MPNPSAAYDVFISHATRDAALAAEIAHACQASGLAAFATADLPAGENSGDILWSALAESRAVLAVLSPTGLTPSMAIEIGASRAWNKPIFAVATDPATTRLPSTLTGVRLYATSGIDDVIGAIHASIRQFSEDDRSALATLYDEADAPVDQYALDPRRLEKLVRKFARATGKTVAGEVLLAELLRLRKQGKLKKRAKSGSKPL